MHAKNNKMGYEPMLPLIIKMSLPAMLSMFIQSLYNVVDSYFVAQISEPALRATSLSFPIQILIIAIAVGTGVGVNSFVARSLGAGRKKDADSAVMHGVVLAIISWLIFIVFRLFFVQKFFTLFTSDAEVIAMGTSYLSIVSVGAIFTLLQILGEKALQGTGNMMIPMTSQLVGAITNIILDPIFIFVFGWGIEGAAIATVIGQFFGAMVTLYGLFSKKSVFDLNIKGFTWDNSTVKKIYEVGFPSILMQSLGAFLTIFLNGIIIQFSEVAVSVLGVYFKLESFVMMPVFGLGQGILPIIGFNYGAKNSDRIHEAYRYGVLISLLLLSVGFVIFQVFPAQLMGIFSHDEAMIRMGVITLRLISLYFIPASLGIVNSTFFQSLGLGNYSLIVSFLRQMGILLPIAYLMSNFGLHFVWLAYPIAETLTLLISTKLRRKAIREYVDPLETVPN
ncbi:MATE family efflux transporter [Erysipelothrix urinaevulpis]|uniref:MATE family efflux transporter n=1 Tax=Erysipelothrix urinaevulpis TaxID=2683717 RepID=UPI00135AD31D|nr:MATE family efflux transporter [Erysipelothrix urinaevulpis]